MDHIVPFAKGGTKTKDNLQLTCRKCNNSKATMSGHDFRPPTTGRTNSTT